MELSAGKRQPLIAPWMMRVLTSELTRAITYRADFWLNFLGRTGALFATSYFLWSSIFAARGVDQIGHYTFGTMMLYSLLAPLFNRVAVGGEFTNIQKDIYEGSLNQYLIYPIPYPIYRWLVFFAQGLLATLQCAVAVSLIWFLGGEEVRNFIQVDHLVIALLFAFIGNTLYFMLAGILEMVAFWQDGVWSLIVMLRFMIFFMGGLGVPLSLYPDNWRQVIEWTPFPYFVGLPMQIAMNEMTSNQLPLILFRLVLWTGILAATFYGVWRAGNKRYTGVGI